MEWKGKDSFHEEEMLMTKCLDPNLIYHVTYFKNQLNSSSLKIQHQWAIRNDFLKQLL